MASCSARWSFIMPPETSLSLRLSAVRPTSPHEAASTAPCATNLTALISKGFLEGYYSKPRIDLDLLEKHNDGLIVLSGCMSGLVAAPLLKNDYEGAKKAALAYRDMLGDRFYIEIM